MNFFSFLDYKKLQLFGWCWCLCRLGMAVLAIAGQAEPFSGYGTGLGDIFRKRNLVQIRIMKIKNIITGKAVKMMVFFSVWIKPPGVSLAFHYIDDLNPGKGDQGTVHRIQ